MVMKRIVVTAFVILIAVMLFSAGCTKKEKPVLRVGTNPEYPPYSYKVGSQLAGIDVDIANRIAEKLKMEVQISEIPFEELFSALSVDKIDMAVSAITITKERQKRFDFTSPYSITDQVLLSKFESKIELSNPEDIGKYTVGSLRGTTGHIYLDEQLIDKDLMPKTKLKLFSTNLEAIGELLKGKLDFVIIDESAGHAYAKQEPVKIAFVIPTREEYGIAMQKGKALNDRINRAMNELIASGEITSIIQSHSH